VTALEDADADAHARMALEGEGASVIAGDLFAPTGTWDVMVTEGAVAAIPDAWLQALAPGGRLGAVIGGARWARRQSTPGQARR
jgi:protein-L-isoaspartate(D-aspartate) O-methyltransferase